MAGTNYLAGAHVDYLKIFGIILKGLWPLWILVLVVILVRLVFRLLQGGLSSLRELGDFAFQLREKQQLAKSGIADIDQMSGKTFEKYLEVLFKKLGYRVERTRYIGDYGADLVTAKDEVKTVIQAKRHKSMAGVKAIQEAVAAKGYYDCQKAMVVTNSFFTQQAIELARRNQVELWDRNKLVEALLSVKDNVVVGAFGQNEAAVSADSQPIEDIQIKCALCGKPVSEKVIQYCLVHQERFGGKIYCFEHQRMHG